MSGSEKGREITGIIRTALQNTNAIHYIAVSQMSINNTKSPLLQLSKLRATDINWLTIHFKETMEQENNQETNVKATIDAVAGLVQAIPVYQDTLQPAAKQIGMSLEVVAKTVNIALAPIKALVWGYEKIEEFITSRVSEKLKNVPEENIITPPLQIAGPAVEALRYSGHDSNLRELYANLLANSMDKETVHKAHPAFVEILKNISSDEAILLQAFIKKDKFPVININATSIGNSNYNIIYSNFSHLYKEVSLQRPDLIPVYLDNLVRLGILEIPSGIQIVGENIYEPLENDEGLSKIREMINNTPGRTVTFARKQATTTSFGRQFINNVVANK